MKPRDPKPEPSPKIITEDRADVDGRIDRALAPYKNLVPPEDLAFMRQQMELYANTHPDVATLIDGLRKRPVVDRSADMTRPGIDEAPTTELPRTRDDSGQKTKPQRKAKPGRR
jgi:hypothetical protein